VKSGHSRVGIADRLWSLCPLGQTTARGTEVASLAAERDELSVAAVAEAQPQEAVGRDVALEEGVKLVFDELRQAGAGGIFGLGKKVAYC
jgi:hypothetical protein